MQQDDAIAVEWREVTDCPTNSNFTAWEVTIGNEKALNESAAATSARQVSQSVNQSVVFFLCLFVSFFPVKCRNAFVQLWYTSPFQR